MRRGGRDCASGGSTSSLSSSISGGSGSLGVLLVSEGLAERTKQQLFRGYGCQAGPLAFEAAGPRRPLDEL